MLRASNCAGAAALRARPAADAAAAPGSGCVAASGGARAPRKPHLGAPWMARLRHRDFCPRRPCAAMNGVRCVLQQIPRRRRAPHQAPWVSRTVLARAADRARPRFARYAPYRASLLRPPQCPAQKLSGPARTAVPSPRSPVIRARCRRCWERNSSQPCPRHPQAHAAMHTLPPAAAVAARRRGPARDGCQSCPAVNTAHALLGRVAPSGHRTG
jgi:hypothetical protein